MIVETTNNDRRHHFTDLTDDELLVIERALLDSEVDVGDASNYNVWCAVERLATEAGLELSRE